MDDPLAVERLALSRKCIVCFTELAHKPNRTRAVGREFVEKTADRHRRFHRWMLIMHSSTV